MHHGSNIGLAAQITEAARKKLLEVEHALSPDTDGIYTDENGNLIAPIGVPTYDGDRVKIVFDVHTRHASEIAVLSVAAQCLELIERLNAMPNQSPDLPTAVTTLTGKVDQLIALKSSADASAVAALDAESDKVDAVLTPAPAATTSTGS